MSAPIREQLQTALGSAFTVDHEIGGGGMSRVFIAHDQTLGRDVVVKLLPAELAYGVNTERFKREIFFAAQLQHPNIVPVLAAGEMDGLPYLTMPYVGGRSLRDRLADGERISIGEAVDILRDVARALSYAHSRGVIHRDIKPGNVLLALDAAVVTDFGVAKAVTVSPITRPPPLSRTAAARWIVEMPTDVPNSTTRRARFARVSVYRKRPCPRDTEAKKPLSRSTSSSSDGSRPSIRSTIERAT